MNVYYLIGFIEVEVELTLLEIIALAIISVDCYIVFDQHDILGLDVSMTYPFFVHVDLTQYNISAEFIVLMEVESRNLLFLDLFN